MGDGVVVAEVRDRAGLERVLEELRLAEVAAGQAPIVVKVPWFSPHPANFVGARELDLLLSCLPAGRAVVVEAYSGARNYGGREITPENGRANWEWIREQDKLFREREGINGVLARHGAEYLNVTEEVWQGRVAPAEAVRRLVEKAYPAGTGAVASVGRAAGGEVAGGMGLGAGAHAAGEMVPAVAQEELYGVVPRALFDLRGGVMVSFAKLKTGSWSLKNLFGLIPDPIRGRWHGEEGQLLGRSIIDISAIYRALFRVAGIVEGIYEVPLYGEGPLVEAGDGDGAGGDGPGAGGDGTADGADGTASGGNGAGAGGGWAGAGGPGGRRRYHTDWGDYEVVPGPGIVLAGWQLVTLDVCAARVVGSEISERSFARIGEKVFGEPACVPPELEATLAALARRIGSRHPCNR
ncbi:MAG: hypothetical protein AB1645_09690 [Bacillota bacterium]